MEQPRRRIVEQFSPSFTGVNDPPRQTAGEDARNLGEMPGKFSKAIIDIINEIGRRPIEFAQRAADEGGFSNLDPDDVGRETALMGIGAGTAGSVAQAPAAALRANSAREAIGELLAKGAIPGAVAGSAATAIDGQDRKMIIDAGAAGAIIGGAGLGILRGAQAGGRATRGAIEGRLPSSEDVLSDRAVNHVSTLGPDMPNVVPGRDLKYKMADDFLRASGPALPPPGKAQSSVPADEFTLQFGGGDSVAKVRPGNDPQTIARNQRYREAHIEDAQRDIVDYKSDRARVPGTPEHESFQAAKMQKADIERLANLEKIIGGEQFRQTLKVDPEMALQLLAKAQGRTVPQLAEDFARLGYDFRNYDARIMGRGAGGQLSGEQPSDYQEYNRILSERFKTPITRPSNPRKPPRRKPES